MITTEASGWRRKYAAMATLASTLLPDFVCAASSRWGRSTSQGSQSDARSTNTVGSAGAAGAQPAGSGPFRLDRQPEQGALLRGVAPAGAASVRLDDREVAVAPDGRFIIGFDRDAPPAAHLRTTAPPLPQDLGAWSATCYSPIFINSASRRQLERRRESLKAT
jgi:hypothetical protein